MGEILTTLKLADGGIMQLCSAAPQYYENDSYGAIKFMNSRGNNLFRGVPEIVTVPLANGRSIIVDFRRVEIGGTGSGIFGYSVNIQQPVNISFGTMREQSADWPHGFNYFSIGAEIDPTESKIVCVFNFAEETYGISVNYWWNVHDYSGSSAVDDWFTGAVGDGDPYGDDPSFPDGGTGNRDNSSDEIPIPNLPSLSATDTNFINVYNPTTAEIKALSSYMWSSDLVDNFKKLFGNPMDAILGLSIVPVQPTNAGRNTIKVGNVSTGVTANIVNTEYVIVDCGSINIEKYWGAYLDYAPYTEIQIYLPYCGTHPLNTNEVMGKTLHVVYHVDIIGGSCLAFVKAGDQTLYMYSGQCSMQIPITEKDYSNTISSAINIAASIGTMVATGGMSAPAPAIGAVQGVANIAQNVTNLAPQVEKTGAVSGCSGLLGIQKPYLIITRPKQCSPEKQNKYSGYPLLVTKKLSDMTGFTSVEEIHLENMSCTSDELNEIENLLKEGIII